MMPSLSTLVVAALASNLPFIMSQSLSSSTIYSRLPDETSPHAATWLQWPHPYSYGQAYANRMEPSWVAMTQALVTSEPVMIIAYDQAIQERATSQLEAANVPMDNVTFLQVETNDVWVSSF